MRAPMLLSLAAAASGAIVEETVQYPLEDEAGTTAEGFIVRIITFCRCFFIRQPHESTPAPWAPGLALVRW
jgi:hypothetical protein